MKLADLLLKVLSDFVIIYEGEWISYKENDWLDADREYGNKKVTYIQSENNKVLIGVAD